MVDFEDESIESTMKALQDFLDDTNLVELHIVAKNKMVTVDSTDSMGYKYHFKRTEK